MAFRKRPREDHETSKNASSEPESDGTASPLGTEWSRSSMLRKGMVILKDFLSIQEQQKLAMICVMKERAHSERAPISVET